MLCGVKYGSGTYTSEGITKLCEALKGSAVTSLECAPAPVLAFLSTPIDTPHHHTPLLAVCKGTPSVPREQPLSLRA